MLIYASQTGLLKNSYFALLSLLSFPFSFLKMKKTILSTLFISIAVAEVINNIVVFGDSYSDAGNNQRLTNGPLWSEDLAVGWNASLYSFAFSGAVCDNDMYAKHNDYIPSITDQVEMYYKENLNLNTEETAIGFWVGLNDIYNIFEKGKYKLTTLYISH